MIFTFLISIVFIAELIIAIAIFSTLRRWSIKVHNYNLIISSLKPSLIDVCVLVRKISTQMVELTEDFIKRQQENIFNNLVRIVIGTLFLSKFKKSKVFKLIGKGLSLLEIVI